MHKKISWGCAVLLGVLIVLPIGGAFFAYRYFYCGVSHLKMPNELATPKVLLENKLFSKTLFFEDAKLGVIHDIDFGELDTAAGSEVGIAGSMGAVFLGNDRKAKSSLTFNHQVNDVRFFDLDSNGVTELFNRGSWAVSPSLIDHQGRAVWQYQNESGCNDMDAGDVDGDRVADFVVGLNGDGGVHLLNKDGKRVWKKEDGNVWHVEFIDVNGDGKQEIIHSNVSGELTIRDGKGHVIGKINPQAYIADFSLCKNPAQEAQTWVLFAQDEMLCTVDVKQKTVKQYDAPYASYLSQAKGVFFDIETSSGYLAVVVNFENWGKAILYIYSPQGELTYQEILPDSSCAIAALRLDSSTEDAVLVGGNGKVWRYSFTHE